MVNRLPPQLCGSFASLAGLLSCGLVLISGGALGQETGNGETVTDVVARVERAVVCVARVVPSPEAPLPDNFDPFATFGSLENGPVPDSFGTGVIVQIENSRTLSVLTNHHLLVSRFGTPEATADRLFIRVCEGHTLEARLQAFDPRSDLAVLVAELPNISTEALQIAPLPLGRGEDLRKGADVFVLGNPLGLARDGSVSCLRGAVASLGRRPAPVPAEETINSQSTIHQLGTLLQLDMSLPLGLSGGGLFTNSGEFVGLTTVLPALRGDPTAAGFAFPWTPSARRIVGTLLRGEEVEYGFLGIDPENSLPADLAAARPTVTQGSCAVVGRVARNSPADRAGLQEGDLVYAIQGDSVLNRSDLVRIVGLLGPEAVAELQVFRPRTRQLLQLTATLAKWPVYDDTRIVATRPQFLPWRGISVDHATGRFRYLPDAFLAEFPQGVIITDIDPNSPAARMELRAGLLLTHLDGEAVRSPAQLSELVADRSETVRLKFSDGREVLLEAE